MITRTTAIKAANEATSRHETRAQHNLTDLKQLDNAGKACHHCEQYWKSLSLLWTMLEKLVTTVDNAGKACHYCEQCWKNFSPVDNAGKACHHCGQCWKSLSLLWTMLEKLVTTVDGVAG